MEECPNCRDNSCYRHQISVAVLKTICICGCSFAMHSNQIKEGPMYYAGRCECGHCAQFRFKPLNTYKM